MMKKKLLIFVCFSMMVLTVSAQDTLKVNFKATGSTNENGWDSILVSDKASYEEGYANFEVFGGDVAVKPVWKNDPVAENVRAVNRDSEQYTGPLANVLSSYIAVDSRYENDCDLIGVELTGLPEGTYTWRSYHHDFNDQYGSFTTTVESNGETANFDATARMISHSLSLEEFEATYGEFEDPTVASDYEAHHVTSSLDSVTSYEYNEIISSGESDVIVVGFRNVLPPDPEMGHNVKFVLMNGFELYESPVTDIEYRQLTQESIQVINETGGNVSITGQKMSEVILYSIDGMIMKHFANADDKVELTNLQKGVYIAKVKLNNGNAISKKIVVR